MRVVISGASAPSVWRVALALLSRQVIHLNLMGWIVGSFAYLGLFFYFWALPRSKKVIVKKYGGENRNNRRHDLVRDWFERLCEKI
jgi:hypothetical protein